jgi:predicted Zn-dependent protease
VLGHEIGHVTARHSVRQQSASQATQIGLTIASIFIPEINTNVGSNLVNLAGGALLSGYGRDQELEADRLGAVYLSRTDYDPHAIIKVIGVLKNQELKDAELAKQEGREPRRYHGLFASHPDNDTRLQQAVGEADKNAVPQAHFEGRKEFLAAIDGLVFNDNSEQGVVRNNRFYHGELGIALQFPLTWQVHNLPDSLIALSPQGEAQIQMKMDRKPTGSPAEYARRLTGSGSPVRTLDVNGLPAALIESENAIVGVIFANKQAFIVSGQVKTHPALVAHRTDILDTINGFHTLTAEESKRVRPLTLHIITARQGDSYARFAQNSPLGKNAESYLRLINAQYPDGDIQPGQLIKIVE